MQLDYIDIGRRIRIARSQAGLTQGELAKRMEVSSSFVGHLERGTRQASLETLVNLANELDLSVDYLLAASLKNSNPRSEQTPYTEKQLELMQEMLAHLDHYVRSKR
ncbi:MAG: helix-turn-helix transcriptional regulator [Clostridia bacterium]|jgi:transcriptional regulator with XRE-family HTH domain|nr:helix-turn-helix transcriptional regulator [Clostridia bacterium]